MSQTTTTTKCPSCGEAAAGSFCSHCGASLGGTACSACKTPLTPGARFCHVCGTPSRARKKNVAALPWAIAASALVVVVLVIAVRFSSSQPPPIPQQGPVASAGGAAPDISNLTPREQADRLFEVIMRAAQSGDTAQVLFHTPMALQAYALLDDLDNDARYHMGLIHLVRGEAAEAAAQADSLEAAVPGHLLALSLRHTAAEARADSEAMLSVYRQFLENYEREIAAQRPEYDLHQVTIEALLRKARLATGS